MGPEYLCRYVEQPDDQSWQEILPMNFCIFSNGQAAEVNTEARLAWSHKNLFLRIICNEPHMDQLKASGGDSPSIWDDDLIQLFLDVQGQAKDYFQLVINPGGRLYGMDDLALWNWKPRVNIDIQCGQTQWVLNLTLPFETLGVKLIQPGDHWRINIARDRPARSPEIEGRVYAWAPTHSSSLHKPKRFGILFFADREGKIPLQSQNRVLPVIFGYRQAAQAIKETSAATPKAQEIEQLLTGPFWEDPPGWLMTFVVLPEKRPLIASDLEGQWVDPPNLLESLGLPPAHIYLRNEDTMMCTGAFLGGLARKLQVTGEDQTLNWANRCVRGLYHVYQLGQQIERGFTPKPYGGKCSKQFSPDNFDNYYIGLGQFYPLADTQHQKLIEEILCESASYWIRHKHACPFPYFEVGMWDNEKDPDPSGHWPLLWLPLYRLAFTLSKDPKFENEYHRLFDNYLRLGQKDELALKAGSFHRWVPQLSALMDWAPESHELWRKALDQWRRLIFEQELTVWRGNIRCGEAIARYLGDTDLARLMAWRIADLTQEKMIYAYQCNFPPVMFSKHDPSKRIYWQILDADFLAETYFAIWDGRMAGLWM